MAWQPPASADDRLWPEDGPSEDKPARTARTGQERPFHPSQEDIQAYCEMSERGAFLPVLKGPGLTPPARKRRGKWGSK
jgi:hypothetical protein